jgi:ferrous-iron efflux pump FieF
MLQSTDDRKLIKIASYLSVIVAIIILYIKSYGWLKTDSQSIFASLVDSLLDITSSSINLIAIRIASAPPDHNHRFGHEKFEDLAVFFQSIFFFISGVFVCFSCAKGLFAKSFVVNQTEGINVMIWSIGLTIILCLYQTYVIHRTKSKIIGADRLHYFSDFLTNVAVIASIMLSKKIWYIDSLIGIAIAFYIMISSYFLFRSAIKNLVDEEFEEHDRKRIVSVVSAYKQIKGMHDLKTRYAANKPFIQFHIELDPEMTILDAHNLGDLIATEISKIFKNAEITIHQDPYGLEEPGSKPELLNRHCERSSDRMAIQL